MPYPEVRVYVAQKGGVGKSTSAVVDAAEGVRRGLRTLLVDLDPQSASSVNAGIERESIEDVPEDETLVGMFRGTAELPTVVFQSPSIEGLDVAPATVDLGQIENDSSLHGVGGKLRRQLEKHPLWDLVIIDLPPNLGRLSYIGIAAATSAVVPSELAGQSMEALLPVMATIKAIAGHEDRPEPVTWILPTKADFRANLHIEAYEAIKAHYGDAVLDPIRASVKVPESYGARQPITHYAPTSNPAQDYTAALTTIFTTRKAAQ